MADNIKEEIKNKIIDYINLGVAGRLIIFKPGKNNFLADLAVQKRGEYKEKEIYFQINSLIVPGKDETVFVKDFLQEDFKADKNFYLLFVYFDKERQKINDYLWLIPSLQFKDIAEVIKLEDGKKILRFKSSSNLKNKNQYSKFIVKAEELGKLILSALSKGGKFSFKDKDSEEKNIINLESLKDFISTARADTYAANATPLDNPRLSESKQLEFQKGEYFYRDIYFSGDKKFIGQEIVYHNLKPVWGMNYSGTAIGKLETGFLKESLSKLVEKCRFGGVCEYKKRELKYQDKGQGSLEEFSGVEEIFLNDKNIYTLNYQGGLI